MDFGGGGGGGGGGGPGGQPAQSDMTPQPCITNCPPGGQTFMPSMPSPTLAQGPGGLLPFGDGTTGSPGLGEPAPTSSLGNVYTTLSAGVEGSAMTQDVAFFVLMMFAGLLLGTFWKRHVNRSHRVQEGQQLLPVTTQAAGYGTVSKTIEVEGEDSGARRVGEQLQ